MINGESVIAVIPARGGSKRTLRKNIREYRGKTLLEWAVRSAQESLHIDKFCVSSDDVEILEHAYKLGVQGMRRPQWLASDHAMNEGVIVDLLYTWKWADWTVLLQPTSPKRTGADIDNAIELAFQGTGCVSVNEEGKRNGAVYVCRSSELISRIAYNPISFSHHLEMPNERSLDIDLPEDFER